MAKQRIKLSAEYGHSVSELIDEYLTDCKIRGLETCTSSAYNQHLAMFQRMVGYDTTLTESVLKGYYLAVNGKDIKQNTKASYLKVVKTFVKWVNKTYELNLPLPEIKKEETIKPIYSVEELELLIKKPKSFKTYVEYRDWLIVLLLLDTGMRSATLRFIKVCDINFDGHCIVSRHMKTHKQIVIPVSTYVLSEMKKFVKTVGLTEDVWLFTSCWGAQLSAPTLRQAIRLYILSRGVTSSTSLHQFRHTYACHYLQNGGNPMRLQQILGHSTLGMTQQYVKQFSSNVTDGYDELSPVNEILPVRSKIALKQHHFHINMGGVVYLPCSCFLMQKLHCFYINFSEKWDITYIDGSNTINTN